MVNSCVAAGCNRTCKDGVSLFTFPKTTLLRKKWIDQVRRTRENWEPTEHSRLCSRHFEVGCFEPCSKLSETFGMKKHIRTYFSHQKDYLQPSILSVWMKEKSSLLQKLKSEQRALVIVGDGRADNPGHSAKYGSYTVMELQMGVVIDVQLVQASHVFHPLLFIYCSYKVLFLIT